MTDSTDASADRGTPRVLDIRTIAILRGYAPDRAVALAQRSWAAGIDLIEVPVQDEDAWPALEAVIAAADGRVVGAGTIINPDRARRALDVGAGVLIMPGTDLDVVTLARDASVAVLPGVMSPTEVQRCLRHGLNAMKLFPARVLGPDHLRSLRPVFPEVRFVATGGVGPENAADLVASGISGLAFGGSIERVLEEPDTLRVAAEIAVPWQVMASV